MRTPRDQVGLANASLVAKIRLTCSREFDVPPEYDFFHANYRLGEPSDVALLRLFDQEATAQRASGRTPSVEDVIFTLING